MTKIKTNEQLAHKDATAFAHRKFLGGSQTTRLCLRVNLFRADLKISHYALRLGSTEIFTDNLLLTRPFGLRRKGYHLHPEGILWLLSHSNVPSNPHN